MLHLPTSINPRNPIYPMTICLPRSTSALSPALSSVPLPNTLSPIAALLITNLQRISSHRHSISPNRQPLHLTQDKLQWSPSMNLIASVCWHMPLIHESKKWKTVGLTSKTCTQCPRRVSPSGPILFRALSHRDSEKKLKGLREKSLREGSSTWLSIN
jgi:hypothetical protein